MELFSSWRQEDKQFCFVILPEQVEMGRMQTNILTMNQSSNPGLTNEQLLLSENKSYCEANKDKED